MKHSKLLELTHPVPPAPRLSLEMFGATAIFTALAIGSGELMFWPALVLSAGAGVLWVAIGAVLLQWIINLEIARYSMATGESMVVGATRAAPWLGVTLLAGATLPWIWPGWVRSAGALFAALTGASESLSSLGMLLSCALILALPARVYGLVEKLQSVMLGGILLGVASLFAILLFSRGGLSGFVHDFLDLRGTGAAILSVASREDAAYFALLGGVVFAGAGGILNVGYGILICEKGFCMGAYAPRVAGLTRARGLMPSEVAVTMQDTVAHRASWRAWLRLARVEHAVLFVGGNIASILFLSATFFMIFAGNAADTSGVSLLIDVRDRLAGSHGTPAAWIFSVTGVLIFYTSALGILDLTSRISASILRTLLGARVSNLSACFHAIVWTQATLSAVLIVLDPRQPFWLLATSAVLNTLVMAVYAATIVWLNRRDLPKFAQSVVGLEIVVLAAGLLYASIFVLTVCKVIF